MFNHLTQVQRELLAQALWFLLDEKEHTLDKDEIKTIHEMLEQLK